MKKLLVLALAALAVTAIAPGAWAESDCCFDANLPPVGGLLQCVQEGTQGNCFARAGNQIYAPAFDCVNNGDTSCNLKANPSAFCTITPGGVLTGACTRSDLQLEQAVPGMSTATLGILLLLLASAATWMLVRRRTGSALA